MPKNTGKGSSRAHPAALLFGSARPEEAAQYWYEQAMACAKEANDLRDRLCRLEESWLVRWVDRHRHNLLG